MTTIKVDIRSGQLQRRFGGLARRIKNRKALFQRIGVKVINEIDKNFKDEGREGKPWQRLKQETIEQRRGAIAKILQDTGALKRSWVFDATVNKVTIGSPLIYSETHQDGRGAIPARPVLPTDKRALEIAVDTAEKFVKEQIKKERLN